MIYSHYMFLTSRHNMISCFACQKTFSRRDALKRHEDNTCKHASAPPPPPPPPHPPLHHHHHTTPPPPPLHHHHHPTTTPPPLHHHSTTTTTTTPPPLNHHSNSTSAKEQCCTPPSVHNADSWTNILWKNYVDRPAFTALKYYDKSCSVKDHVLL